MFMRYGIYYKVPTSKNTIILFVYFYVSVSLFSRVGFTSGKHVLFLVVLIEIKDKTVVSGGSEKCGKVSEIYPSLYLSASQSLFLPGLHHGRLPNTLHSKSEQQCAPHLAPQRDPDLHRFTVHALHTSM